MRGPAGHHKKSKKVGAHLKMYSSDRRDGTPRTRRNCEPEVREAFHATHHKCCGRRNISEVLGASLNASLGQNRFKDTPLYRVCYRLAWRLARTPTIPDTTGRDLLGDMDAEVESDNEGRVGHNTKFVDDIVGTKRDMKFLQMYSTLDHLNQELQADVFLKGILASCANMQNCANSSGLHGHTLCTTYYL